MNKKYFLLIIFLSAIFPSCNDTVNLPPDTLVTQKEASDVIKEMTKIMVHDISNPPLASRFFSYACLAGYEVISQNNPSFKSMHTLINDYPLIEKPKISNYSYSIAAVFAMILVAKKMQPSGNRIDILKHQISTSFIKKGATKDILDSSIIYANQIADAILEYAKGDGYRLISSFKKYTPVNDKGCWVPTPPLFLSAVEPYFNTLRTFFLDSVSQYKPIEPIKFSDSADSDFFQLMNDVYQEQKSSNIEHREIAQFWDCNPFAVFNSGHLQVGIKKISPGAHWMGIAGIACKKSNLSFDSTLQVYTLLSTTLMDAFISCWDEKFRSNRVRPETVIRKYIDSDWQPLLQTPPFPEYSSGHSVISTASAQILTYFFGDSFGYVDSVEKEFGLPDRKYSSFNEAASEAAISRYYGGIHFMDAITEGKKSGKEIGSYVLNKYFNH